MAQGVTGSTHSDCVRDEPAPEESTDIIITRDNLGSVWQVAYPDDAGRDLTYTRDALGNVTHLSAGTGSHGVVQQYAYNSLNLPVSETLTVNGTRLAPGADKASVVYTYNTLGQTDSLTYPDGVAVAFAPNAFGEPTQVARVANSYATAHAYVTNARYYPTGALDSFQYHNGLSHKTTLNSRKLPQRIRDAGATVTALDYAYTYDYALNITRLLDGRDSATRQYSLTDLSYDGLNRLTATTGGADIGNSHITYDGLGNILTYRSKDRDFSYHYNAPGGTDSRKNLLRRVDHAGDPAIEYKRFSYDDRGNVTANGFNNFTYNRANQMVTADNNHYVYDGHNRRVSKTNSEGTEYSLYTLDGTLLYRQTDSGGINYVYLGNKLVAKDGFIPEDSGVQHYRPFGEAIEEPADDIGYTGHKYDADIGLSYMQARYYDPVIGRFYSNDPVGTIGHLYSGNGIQGFNRYAYANNNPYKYVDPDGHAALNPVTGAVAGGAVAGPPGAIVGGLIGAAGLIWAGNEMAEAFDQIGQMNESSDASPEIDETKQNEHKEGTREHKSRVKNAPTKDREPSVWIDSSEADDLTRDAWETGTPVEGQPNKRRKEYGRPVGTKPNGDTQTGVQVSKNKKGKIHGTPFGSNKRTEKKS